MSVAKIVRAMREHPHLSLENWARLPSLLETAWAAFPSTHDDGSIVVALDARDDRNDPVVAPLLWDAKARHNVVLSLYGRGRTDTMNGDEWIESQIAFAARSGLQYFRDRGPADTEPKPEPESSNDPSSWSPGAIPADRPAGPIRKILSIRNKINTDGESGNA